MEVLWADNVRARRYFHPGVHRMEPYRTLFPDAGRLLPETERLSQRVLSLPTGTAVGPEEVRVISAIIRVATLWFAVALGFAAFPVAEAHSGPAARVQG